MTIAKRTPIFQCLLLAGVLSLAACGGGGGGKKQPPADTTPNAISLAASTNVEPNTLVTSAPVTISGINTASPVSIVGGEYSISGGAFTANPGSITNGQTLTVRITASDKTNTPKEAVVTVGGVSAKFAVTTAADVTPEAFTFAPKNDAQLNAEYTSDPITVSGIDVAVPVSVTGGLYSINGGEFTSAAGTVSAGQAITVKTTAAAKTETAQEAVLTIGGVSGTFSVTTIQDTMPPVAEFKFPTPYTMSEAASVKVRGTATDDNAITNVKVVVRSYKLETPTVTLSTAEINATPKAEANGVKDFSSWTVDVPLTALAENEIKVVATDVRNNSIALDAANQVVIRQANVSSAFPDEVNEFDSARNSTFDTDNGRNRILVSEAGKILAVDIATGLRAVLIEHQNACMGNLNSLTTDSHNSRLYGICDSENIVEINLIDGSSTPISIPATTRSNDLFLNLSLDNFGGRNRLVMMEYSDYDDGGRVVAFSLDSREFSVVSGVDENPPIIEAFGSTAVDEKGYWVTTGGQNRDALQHKVIRVDATTGKREIYSDNSIGLGELFSAKLPNGETAVLQGVVKDDRSNRLIVMEDLANKILTIDLDTRERRLFKDISYIGSNDKDVYANDFDLDHKSELLLITDGLRKAILMVDNVTGEKLILSKSPNNFN